MTNPTTEAVGGKIEMNHSLIATASAFVLRNVTAVLFVIALLVASLDRSRPNRFLAWLLLLTVGIGGLWSGFFHTVYPEVAARFIGWQDSPFQFEVGMADLSYGVAGCVAFGPVTVSGPRQYWSTRSSCWATRAAMCIR